MEDALTKVIPSLADRGVFGSGKYVSITADNNADIGFQFGSEMAMIKLKLRLDGGETKIVPVVIKVQIDDELQRRTRDGAIMFQNEVTMYNEILPFLNNSSFRPYPEFYHGFATGGKNIEKDILIVGNIKYSGFTQCREKVYVDFSHIAVAMKRIGELHAWSFVAKEKDEKKFNELKGKLRGIDITKDEEFDFVGANYLAMKRGIDPFLVKGIETEVLTSFLEIVQNLSNAIKVITEPMEPFGVILHGDFCKTNLLYRHDSTGRPLDCSYFDFQLSKYGSPAVDISFFLYMHTTSEMRTNHWDDFLRIYWKSVRDNVPSDIDLPCFEEFLEHFATRAAYGYLPCSFFLPQLLEENPLTFEVFEKLNKDERKNLMLNLAGDIGLQSIVDIVSHLLNMKYIHRFLDYYSKIHHCRS